ncbi:class A beta-lactamase, subclass A2 [Mucilaginibacter sp. Bleaf8]|uniref:class A beta-lactamase, subclass A2 n=1 Tax=Mucilaginibacter sp. Bleaf8 TaxID=2834430 RepID=UPI001BD12B84|nr:class A beta-lactamase, subclass A2 [Mucilaginibacter sp. Bleaf8]MBS7563482.1 class A beta-lactamase, subclass A2 [Mucilaginibacter sp. Bleaf8]
MKNSFSFIRIFACGLLTIVLCTTKATAQKDTLRAAIRQAIDHSNGKVGVAFSILEDNDTLSVNNNRRYVMHSVFKFPVAMAVLHWVDAGHLKLDQKTHITKADLPETYSPLRDKYPNGNVDVSIADLLSYMVSQSDNDACDILLKVVGGTPAVEAYLRELGVKQMYIKASERQMASAWPVQYRNWCKPAEMVKLLNILYTGKALSKTSNNYLWKLMLETSTGPNRIKGLLPAGTQVAHKTGTGPVNEKGMASATNDAGIVLLPNGKHLAIAIFVNDSYDDRATREKLIAQISKAIYDYAIKN